MSESKGVVGLTNIGNTCYGNATLQAIRHQVDFTIFILQGQHTDILKRRPSSEKSRLLEAYGELVRRMWAGEKGREATNELWGYMIPAAIKEGFGQFRIPIAHDAHEFLVFLLDQFHEALSEEVSMTIRNTGDNADIKDALDAWKGNFEKKYSPFVELLFGLQRKSVACESCKHESVSWETMNMLKVCVPKSKESLKLIDLLVEEAKGETIEGYKCEKCSRTAAEASGEQEKPNASLTRRIWRLGNWVIVIMKRNENNGRRINTPVEIPMETTFGAVFHESSREPSSRDTYELFSTIHHHGSSGGGHYTAHAKHPVTKRWAHYDDDSAHPVESPCLDASTYIVMYRRKSE